MNQTAVVSIESARVFSEERYRREREEIRKTHGDSSKAAIAKRDQALASLFCRSGWTQEQIAKIERCGPQYVARRLKFGQFLAFLENSPTGEKSEIAISELTEGRFRDFWNETDKNEKNDRIRFAAVQKLISQATVILVGDRHFGLGRKIIEQFGDAKWHELDTIVGHIKEPEIVISRLITDLTKKKNTYRIGSLDKKQRGKATLYRIVRASRQIDLGALMQDLGPILEGLKAEGKKNVATISPGTVAHLVHQLEQLLEKLAK